MTGTAAASIGVSGTLDALARDIGAAQAHAAVLRERLETAVEPSDGADTAGIADGGVDSSLSSLRLVARALDRRVERLRLATAGELPPDRTEVLLVLRTSLADFRWTIETMGQGPNLDTDTGALRDGELLRLEASLRDLDLATAAMTSFDWPE
jgi:hypothetical protein